MSLRMLWNDHLEVIFGTFHYERFTLSLVKERRVTMTGSMQHGYVWACRDEFQPDNRILWGRDCRGIGVSSTGGMTLRWPFTVSDASGQRKDVQAQRRRRKKALSWKCLLLQGKKGQSNCSAS